MIPPWLSILIYHLGDEKRPFGCCSAETYSHPISMKISFIFVFSPDNILGKFNTVHIFIMYFFKVSCNIILSFMARSL
jgi:hypothetical protein